MYVSLMDGRAGSETCRGVASPVLGGLALFSTIAELCVNSALRYFQADPHTNKLSFPCQELQLQRVTSSPIEAHIRFLASRRIFWNDDPTVKN